MLTLEEVIVPETSKYAIYTNVCVVCYKRITEYELKKCSGCKLVFYCSKEHQKSHWPDHKQLCKVVQTMIKSAKNVGIFDNFVPTDNPSEWNRFRMSMIRVCENEIERKLNRQERSLFLNPYVCNVCRLYKEKNMITCKTCCIVCYCSENHMELDKAKHSLVCKDLKLCLDYDFSCHTPYYISGSICDVKQLPCDMEKFVADNVSVESKPRGNEFYAKYFLSDSLTLPLTIIYVIEKSQVLLEKEALIIHLLGCELFENMGWWCFEYIFHYFPQLKAMHLIFIGPDNLINLPPVLSCKKCSSTRTISFTSSISLYHNYVTSATIAPHIILAFNCGFHELILHETNGTWRHSMQPMCSFEGTVVAFTSFNYFESKQDLAVLKAFSNNPNVNVIVECQKNPFRSMIPLLDSFENEVTVFHNNNFINIVIT